MRDCGGGGGGGGLGASSIGSSSSNSSISSSFARVDGAARKLFWAVGATLAGVGGAQASRRPSDRPGVTGGGCALGVGALTMDQRRWSSAALGGGGSAEERRRFESGGSMRNGFMVEWQRQ